MRLSVWILSKIRTVCRKNATSWFVFLPHDAAGTTNRIGEVCAYLETYLDAALVQQLKRVAGFKTRTSIDMSRK